MNNEINFSQLIEETYRALCYFLRYLGLPEAEVEDMAQEVYLKAHKALNKYDPERPFKTWLFSIAKNAFIDWTRKQKTKRKFMEQNFIKEYSDTFADSSDRRTDIKSLVGRLSAEEQILVELRFFQDLPFKDIAELTGLSPGAVKMRMFRIIDKMKTRVKRKNYGENL